MGGPRRARRALLVGAGALALAAAVATLVLSAQPSSSTTTTTLAATTTTTIARERPQVGWAVAEASGRGVMVDTRQVHVGSVVFRAVRLRARTTLLRWHVGLGDPNLWQRAPRDAGPAIDWATEGPAGVVAVFNGGFKQSANAGGSMVDGFTLVPPQAGRMTIALDAAGHWRMGVWGHSFPPAGFRPVAWRQNLGPLVVAGAPSAAAHNGSSAIWGSPLGNVPPEARTGLGLDAQGNLVYVATMTPIMPIQLARAMVEAGVVTGMQLDINPFWPILGVPLQPIHHPGGHYAIALPGANHSPNIYDTGWQRDFFVALAEPSSWSCSWQGPGLGPRGAARAQPLRLVGSGCATTATTTTTTTSAPTTTTSTPATTTTGG